MIAADGASKFGSLVIDVSESVGATVCRRRRGSLAGVVTDSEIVSLNTTSISFTSFSSRYTLGWPPFVP